ncbi:hypothetical protein K6V92_10455 [Cupriavidus respiraculi]|uniref:hypothetical protein n=1 Tax=Cupriavidus respiraculi TaxID=195930 RepID=UPI001C9487B8|nr:hypothetical protein [Cupriavidus respiraculi]MBY4947039.1 hypothetical protein [Cupriavidus respiraculi]
MSEIKDGGPAFPHDERAQHNERDGMTLRDYFAAKAMQAYLSAYPCQGELDSTQADMGDVASDAYRMADAMLDARRQQS